MDGLFMFLGLVVSCPVERMDSAEAFFTEDPTKVKMLLLPIERFTGDFDKKTISLLALKCPRGSPGWAHVPLSRLAQVSAGCFAGLRAAPPVHGRGGGLVRPLLPPVAAFWPAVLLASCLSSQIITRTGVSVTRAAWMHPLNGFKDKGYHLARQGPALASSQFCAHALSVYTEHRTVCAMRYAMPVAGLIYCNLPLPTPEPAVSCGTGRGCDARGGPASGPSRQSRHPLCFSCLPLCWVTP